MPPFGATLLKRLHPRAKLPQYATAGAACFDLFPVLEEGAVVGADGVRCLKLKPGGLLSVRTGWAIVPPAGWCLELHSRSGQGKVRVSLSNRTGIVDSDYTGEVLALVVNEGSQPFMLREDKAMCQGKLAYSPQAEFLEVLVLPETGRGAGGFGSTDKPGFSAQK